MDKYKKVVEQLEFARDEITRILTEPEDQLHTLRLVNNLQRDIDHVSLLLGLGDPKVEKSQGLQPLTSIAGEKVQIKKKVTEADTEPEPETVRVLREQVEHAYKSFLTTTTPDIKNNMDDKVIRGVAKKAGLNKVTKDNPEKVTPAFIEEIKKEIRKKTPDNTEEVLNA